MSDHNAAFPPGSDLSEPGNIAPVVGALQDQFHDYLQAKFGTDSGAHDRKESPEQVAMLRPEPSGLASPEPYPGPSASASPEPAPSSSSSSSSDSSSDSSSSSSGPGTILNYAGYITYASLAASAFGHDDPLQLQTRATRFFQEKILHHHAIDNPQVWEAMGDTLMTEEHLTQQGAKFKAVKFGTLKNEVKHESAADKNSDKDAEHDGKEAQGIINDISGGLRSPADYVLAAKFLYSEAVNKADARAGQEGKDHKDEKRLLGRLNLLSGETDRTDALSTRDSSIDPLLDELGSRVAYRLDEAALMERYGSKVPELGWSTQAESLRDQAKAIYDDPAALSEPVRMRLHQKYPDILIDRPNQ